jgi:hypothetical protein
MPAMKLACSLAIIVATPALALADEPRREADPVHDFHTTDRLTPVSTFGMSLGYEILEDDTAFDSVIGFDLSGHVVTQSGAGGYVVLPVSWIDVNDPLDLVDDDDEVMLGNVEVGGLYAHPLGRRSDLLFHGGIALPTADDDNVGDTPFTAGAQVVASTPRYGELVQRVINSTWLRLGLSPMGTAGIMFWRLDAGVDLMIDDEDDTAAEIDPVFRINAAIGVDLGPADLSGELVTNVLDDDNDDVGDEVAHTFAVGARFKADRVQPGLALILPIDFDDFEDLEAVLALSITARLD